MDDDGWLERTTGSPGDLYESASNAHQQQRIQGMQVGGSASQTHHVPEGLVQD